MIFAPLGIEFIDWVWVGTAGWVGMMGLWIAAAERFGERRDPEDPDYEKVPVWAPMYFISLSVLLFLYANRSQWFQEDFTQVVMELTIAGLIIGGSYWLFSEIMHRYGLSMPKRQFELWYDGAKRWHRTRGADASLMEHLREPIDEDPEGESEREND